MSTTDEQDLKETLNLLKKVEKWEKTNEDSKFLFIVAIIGLIAIFEGVVAYLLQRYVHSDVTSVYIGAKLDDPILTAGVWIIQIGLLSSLVIYSQTGKGILDTWTPIIRKLAVIWGTMYVLSFIINVFLIFIEQNDFGPSFWALNLGLAFFLSTFVLRSLEDIKNIQIGLFITGVLVWITGIVIYFIPDELSMLTLGVVVGVLLLIVSGYNFWKE